MSETGITTVRVDEGGVFTLDADGERASVEGESDWARVDALSDEEIERAIASDPDTFSPTPEQLAKARGVETPDVRAIRERRNLSLKSFAMRYGLRPQTLRDWETGKSSPGHVARLLLKVIELEPEAVERALAH